MDYSGSNVKGGNRDYFSPPNEDNIDQLGPGRELPVFGANNHGSSFWSQKSIDERKVRSELQKDP